MRLLVVNAGSSSLKLSLLDDDRPLASLEIEGWDGRDVGAVRPLLERGPLDVVGHRVVHGGGALAGPVRIDERVERDLAALTSLAPLHQGAALAGIRALRSAVPGVPHVACFDTAFHATLPAAAATYALPAAWRRRFGLRRYGFHGLSHAYVARRAAALVGRPVEDLRTVSCHLGSGSSLCAIAGGRSVDTTMGFTPLEGLVMATRSGSVDPGLLLWLLQEGRLGLEEVARGLEHEAGLAGLAELREPPGARGDLRAVLAARAAGDAAAGLAVDVFLHRLGAELAAMTAALGGLDVVAFTGGIGARSAFVRAAVAERLAHLGIAVDPDRNARGGAGGGGGGAGQGGADLGADLDISAPGAPVRALVIEAREDLEIARQVRTLLLGDREDV